MGRRWPRLVRRSGQPRADEGRSLNEEGLRPSATNAGKRRRWRASASTPYSALYGTSPVEVLTEGAVAAERYRLPEPSDLYSLEQQHWKSTGASRWIYLLPTTAIVAAE